MKMNHIYQGDCTEIMTTKIDKGSIHMIYADPPYNLSGKQLTLIKNKTGGPFYKMNEKWDIWGYDEYLFFTEKWLRSSYDVLVQNGSLYVSCTFHNVAEVIIKGKKLGFKLNNVITWYKTNAMPNITKRTYTHATEYVCWFVKGRKWKFNYVALKELNPQKTKDGKPKQMRDFVELPLVQGKERLRRRNKRALHPTQKPEKLLEIIMIASTDKGDLVLDPFFGTGTTGVVAHRLGRRWIGIEINKRYYRAANRRIFSK